MIENAADLVTGVVLINYKQYPLVIIEMTQGLAPRASHDACNS